MTCSSKWFRLQIINIKHVYQTWSVCDGVYFHSTLLHLYII